MTFFNRQITGNHNQHAQIVAAYRAAGLDAPARTGELSAVVESGTTDVQQLIHALTHEAITGTTPPADWHAEAVEKVKDAQARETLAKGFRAAYNGAVAQAMPAILATAVLDLTPLAKKTITALEKAARALPAGPDALDAEANLNANTGDALPVARKALTTLGILASIYHTPSPITGLAPALGAALPVVALPPITVERVAGSLGVDQPTLNRESLAGTYAVREASNTARKHGADLALIDIARGAHEGMHLEFADADTLRQRQQQVRDAFVKKVDKPAATGSQWVAMN